MIIRCWAIWRLVNSWAKQRHLLLALGQGTSGSKRPDFLIGDLEFTFGEIARGDQRRALRRGLQFCQRHEGECTFQCGPHAHASQFGNGEIKMLDRAGSIVLFQQEFGKLQMGERQLRTEPNLPRRLLTHRVCG